MDKKTQARYNFVLAFQHCWNGEEFPIFRKISASERECIHTGYCAVDLLDEALNLHPDFQEARNLRSEIWHAILTNNLDYNYPKYLKSKAWSETRKNFFEKVGRQCICGNLATQVHHKTYDNIGKENLLTDLVGLCDHHHKEVHQPKKTNGVNNVAGKEYWDKFETYVEKNGGQLRLFPEPDLPSFLGIQIDQNTIKSEDIYKDGAIWLTAYRSRRELQTNLRLQSLMHYSALKKQGAIIKNEFDNNLGELRWLDDKKCIGFSDATVGNVREANTDQEYPWLHDRLIRLHEVFQPRVLALQDEN